MLKRLPPYLGAMLSRSTTSARASPDGGRGVGADETQTAGDQDARPVERFIVHDFPVIYSSEANTSARLSEDPAHPLSPPV
jgi:hypothetical protein